MEEEWRYMCPRPRRRRACNPCKERKVRCLRDEKLQDVEICRRYDKHIAIRVKSANIEASDEVFQGSAVQC